MNSVELKDIHYKYPEMERYVFRGLSLSLPRGIISLVGQNGTGKSTLLLLAGGCVLPEKGRIRIMGIDTADLSDEYERQRWVSFIFQNMEFETEENIGDLLYFVYENGFHFRKSSDFISTLIEVFELSKFLEKKTQEISKGELQRAILAFSLLYGSKILMMDEPIFAMENYQKERAMDFMTNYARENKVSVYYSVHELDISEKYSDYILLFYRNRHIKLGKTNEIFKRKIIEQAYEVPFHMLKMKETYYRQSLSAIDINN